MRSLWILFLSVLLASARRGERPRYRTAYACEGSDLHIKCDDGHLIRLIRANYGRFSISICNEHGNLDWSVDCMSPISFRVMQQSCGMKKTCSLPASSTKFGDPCPDTVKYLEAHYQCVPESTTTVSTKPSPPILFLPTMPNNIYSTAVTSQKVPDTSSTTIATKVITVSSEIVPSEGSTPSIASVVQTSTLLTSLTTESNVIEKATKKSTYATLQPSLHDVSPEQHCAAVRARNVIWNRTGAGITAKQQCPGGAIGEAQWYCDSKTSKWYPKQPDMSACKSLWLISLRERLSFNEAPEYKITFSIINIAAELAVMARAKTLYGKDLIQMTEIIQQLVLKMAKRISEYPDSRQRYQIVKELVQSIVDICNSLLDDFHTDAWNDLSELERRTVVSALLREMEQSALLLAESLMISGEKHFNRVQPNVLVTATILKVNTVSSTRLPSVDDIFGTTWARTEDFIFIPRQALLDSARNGLVKIIYIAYKKVDSILNSSSGRGKGSYETSSEMENIMPIINSKIVAASLGQTSTARLSEPIAIVLKNTLQQDNVSEPRCVFWSFDQRSWSEEGCWVQTFNRSHTICNCNHFTNFAILRGVDMIQLTYKNEVALQVITYVGCIVSIVCLLVSIMAFQIFRVLKSDHIIIRKNLCICLLIAEAIFMGGINQTHLYIICGVIAGLLHYFFLAAFAWMFWEGFHIYLILSEVFESEKSRIKWYYAIAYTFPAMIVGICAAIDPSSYGTHRHCWLRADNYFLFSFVGPAIFIILASVFFLGYSAFIVCCPITQNSTVKAKEQTKLSNVKIMIRDAVLLVILLTLTWTFGLMYLNEESVVMAYIFTTLNTLQGIFIFLFHCVRNDKVQREYQKFVHRAQWLPECIKNTKSGDHCSSFYIHSNRPVTAPPTSTTYSLSHQSWDLQKEQPSTSSSALHSTITQDQPPLTSQQRLSREKSLSRGIQGTQKKHNSRTTTKNLPNRTEQGVTVDYPVDCSCDKVVVAANLHAQQPERMVVTPYSHMTGHGERCHSYVDHIYETIDDELDLPCCERRLFPCDSHGIVPEGHIRTHSDASRQSSSSFNCDHHPLLPPNLPQRNALTALAQVLNSAPRNMPTLQNLYCQKCPEDSSCIHQSRILDPREAALAHEHDKTCSTLPIHSLRGNKDDTHLRNVLTFSHADRVPWNSTLPDVTRLSNDNAVVMAILDGEHVVCKLQSDVANRSKCQTSNDPAHHLTTDC